MWRLGKPYFVCCHPSTFAWYFASVLRGGVAHPEASEDSPVSNPCLSQESKVTAYLLCPDLRRFWGFEFRSSHCAVSVLPTELSPWP